jgi:uncharacterized membrane protein
LNDDHHIERQMGRLLQAGVLVSATVMAIGGILYLAQHGADTPNLGKFRKAEWTSSTRLLQSGILLMIATPILRVVFSVFAFARAKDWLYAGLGATVLTLIMWGFAHPT